MSSDPEDSPGDLETTAPETTDLPPAKRERQTLKEEITAMTQHRSLCWSLFSLGWAMGSIGPLLYRIQQFYGVGLSELSFIFVSTYVGIACGGLVNMPLTEKFGFGKTMAFAVVIQAGACGLQFLAVPFRIFVISFSFGGFAQAVQVVHANAFVSQLSSDSAERLAKLNAAFALGALVSPLSTTLFSWAQHWTIHFLISMMLAIITLGLVLVVFKLKEQHECLREGGANVVPKTALPWHSHYRQILSRKSIHLLSIFMVIHSSIELTIATWMVIFMRVVRGGGTSSNYIVTVFFGGLSIGRVMLLGMSSKIGETRAVYIYISIITILQFAAWLIPSLVFGTLTVFFIGIFIGPIHPIVIGHTSRLVPVEHLTGSIAWITTCGALGNAVIPFLTGTLMANFGIEALQPLLVGQMMVMSFLWFAVPTGSQADL
ncbi:hypothetical protein M413DRAFT_77791 [Hebeloma cylindrosporum]|uniref:Major facilitator superfamily (MFS) profile domain-containing protein n=1 Tax=Hebeloma cylindrosporum TaxID=76867 RepID=A0A0C3BXJ9_HEBCY|nr:hypothetical protein M413DRAFT_77791 [Hebeloma cylindrosporum h7]